MDDTEQLLSGNQSTCASVLNENVRRVYTPEYKSINAQDPVRRVSDDADNFDDSLLAPVPKVVEEIQTKTKLYKRRWYIVCIYAMLCFTQNMVWNTWGPISASSEDAFGWDEGTVTLLTNWGPIAFIVGTIFFSWLIAAKGLRVAVVSSMALVAAGSAVRCISSEPPVVTWINHIACALNGLAGPVGMFGPPVISTTWFGPHERTTATALSMAITMLGLSASFVLGPLLVPDRLNSTCEKAKDNYSSLYMGSEDLSDCAKYFNNSADRIAQERKDIMVLLYTDHHRFLKSAAFYVSNRNQFLLKNQIVLIECGLSVFILLLLLVYFPPKPPLPPSVSASLKREDFVPGLKTLFRRSQFWVLTFIYGVTFGVSDCWSNVIDVVVNPYGVTEKQAGWMGFYGDVAIVLAFIVAARFADRFSRHFKIYILVLYGVAAVFFLCFALLCAGIIPFSIALLYIFYIAAITFLNAASPLIYELAGEMTFPVDEATTDSVLALSDNIVGFVFLFIPTIPHIGTSWMNWGMVGAIGVCLPVILLLRENYYRLEIDEHSETKAVREY